jgi:type VI secretion system secreted protein VgrG
MFTIPRVGHEVLVAFVNGDPDCPLVVGRVHNARESVPFPLPENKTVSTWKSASSPGGKGFNELRFDDAKGREHVFLQSEKDMDQLVKHDLKQAVGNNQSRYVQNDEHVAIGGDRTKFVNQNELETTGLSRETFVGLNRLSTVGIEDSTLVGRRWSVTVGRGLTGKLVGELEQAAGSLGNVVRNAATSVLGFVPDNPLAKAADAALSGFGKAAFEKLHNALKVLDGFGMDAGPPPTTLEIVDRQIKFSTGEASIILDGPNVTISAQGTIALHAMKSISILGEEELALGGREKVAIVSATDDVIVQAFKDVHLNPFVPANMPPPAVRLEGDVKGNKPRCEIHPDHDMIEDGDGWRCPLDLYGGGEEEG